MVSTMKIDTRALRRALATLEHRIAELERRRQRWHSVLVKHPSQKSPKNREAHRSLVALEKLLAELEPNRLRVAGAIEQLSGCADSCSTQCQDVRQTAKDIESKAPPPKRAVRRARAPSASDQALIAQAHWFELMAQRDPKFMLPHVERPAPDWRPDGPRQIGAYNRIWRAVQDFAGDLRVNPSQKRRKKS
jgi:hypothetical protein